MKVKGKFLYNGGEKFFIKGVTYGTFKPDSDGNHFPERHVIEKDFSMMAQSGINSIRTYTVPTIDLLDIAEKFNLKVMVGLPWEQHITFLDDPKRKKDIVKRVKEGVLQCNNHPAILCFAIGNEIPSSIVRWYGKEKIENFLKLLFKTVKKINSNTLVTYVNYPTTEYLNLSFLDFDCFNVYLETPKKLADYLSRLHTLSADRPLVLAEIGLDSRRNGIQKQAETLLWQIETVFAKGSAGIFVFAWTDEWWRGGSEIEDWDFGLVDRNRNPKPALYAVSLAIDKLPFSSFSELPKISVVVCTYNGSSTIRKCIEGILKVDYPNFEIIVVNDGSTDNTSKIVSEYPVILINTENHGLSNARNTGMNNAEGDIIAYIDDDAYPDQHWLQYLAYSYLHSDHSCIGGPNIAPYDSEFISICVANSPGGPVHVMVSDEIAEHVPGCNMSFKKAALKKIGGFDPVFRSAGDDVDVCWRIMEAGGTIGFHPSALVWHHRRNSFKAYWKQQKGYGKAEALLEAKWPEKYNSFGHITWSGRIYGNGSTLPLKVKKDRIFHGTWGSSLFQSLYQPSDSFINSIPLMPEWYLLSALIGVLSLMGIFWTPLLILAPLFILTIVIIVFQATLSARNNSSLPEEKKKNRNYTFFIILLHMIQPVARLYGRLSNGLTPWRKRGASAHPKFLLVIGSRMFTHWSEVWMSAEEWLLQIEKNIVETKTRIKRGGVFDKWDIQINNGLFGKSRCILTIEEHGAGKQFIRFKCWTVYSFSGIVFPLVFTVVSLSAFLDGQWIVSVALGLTGLIMFVNLLLSASRAFNNLYLAFTKLSGESVPEKNLKPIPDDGNNKIITQDNSKRRKKTSLLNVSDD